MKEFSTAFSGLTDPGILNKKNEDSIYYEAHDLDGGNIGVFAVADGVGGLMNGDAASRIATDNMAAWWNYICKCQIRREELQDSLKACFEKTNADIRALSMQQGIKMATTLSTLAIFQSECYIAHIGDSRIYRLRRGMVGSSFQMLTKDHSCLINTESGGKIIQKSVLTECLGYKDTIHPLYSVLPVGRGDIYLLCSDGAYKTINNENLKRIINSSPDMPSICSNIVHQAKLNSEKDNISVIAIQINQK